MDTVAAEVRRRELSPARYAQLAAASALSLYLIVLTGAAVRLTGSGLACESWPGCQEGAFFPAVNEHSTIEFGNRVMALFPIVLSLATWFLASRTHGLGRWVTWLAGLTFLGTIAQAPLGLLTIRLDLHPLMVATHFLLALVVLATATAAFGISFLLLLVWLLRHRDRAGVLAPGAVILLVLLLVQMGVGELQWRNELPWWLVLIHVGLAAAVWAWTVALVTALWRTPRRLTR